MKFKYYITLLKNLQCRVLKLADKPSGLGGGGHRIKLTIPDPGPFPLRGGRNKIKEDGLTAPWRFESFSYSALIG